MVGESASRSRTALAERYGSALREKFGSRAIEIARTQEMVTRGEAKASWRLIVEALENA